MKLKLIIVATVVGLLVAGCAADQVRSDLLAFNKGHSEGNEQMLLANIIRSSRFKHPSFSEAQSLTTSNSIDARISGNFNFGPDAARAHSLSPSLGGSRRKTAAAADFGGTKAAKQLYAPLNGSRLRDLLTRGWVYPIPLVLLLQRQYVNPSLYRLVQRTSRRRCRSVSDAIKRSACNYINEVIAECGDRNPGDFINNPRNSCDFRHFLVATLRLRIADLRLNTRTEPMSFRFPPGSKLERVRKRLNNPKKKRFGIELTFRSPVQIIEFLGALAAPQLYQEPAVVPRVPLVTLAGAPRVPLLRVVRGRDIERRSAVSVRMFGEWFAVPEGDYLDETHNYSALIMAYVIELMNRVRQESEIGSPPLVLLQ